MPDTPFRVALANGLRYASVLDFTHLLDDAGASLTVVDAPTSDAEAAERLAGFHGIIWPHGPYRLTPFDQLPDLQGVIAPTVGVDHVDLDAATAAGVVVGHLRDFATEQTADMAMFLIIGTVRRVPQMWAQWRQGNRAIPAWEAQIRPIGDMRGATLALIGFGRIARAVAVRAQGFGMRCIAYGPTVSPWEAASMGVELADLETAFTTGDAVSVHLPLSTSTHHFVNGDLLSRMKSSAVLINVSRGPVVDEAALLEALQAGRIAGAGLDVFEQEPVTPDNPLVNLPNVLWLPHAGGSSDEGIRRVGEGSAEQMAWLAQGYWPRHVANAGVQPRIPLRRRGYPDRDRAS